MLNIDLSDKNDGFLLLDDDPLLTLERLLTFDSKGDSESLAVIVVAGCDCDCCVNS